MNWVHLFAMATSRKVSMAVPAGALLSGAASVRLLQLVASVTTLLFTASALIVILEKRTFHDALYFVITTLTTVSRHPLRYPAA